MRKTAFIIVVLVALFASAISSQTEFSTLEKVWRNVTSSEFENCVTISVFVSEIRSPRLRLLLLKDPEKSEIVVFRAFLSATESTTIISIESLSAKQETDEALFATVNDIFLNLQAVEPGMRSTSGTDGWEFHIVKNNDQQGRSEESIVVVSEEMDFELGEKLFEFAQKFLPGAQQVR